MTYPQRGYPRLAVLTGNEKDVTIFRRFDDLNIPSLLAIQSEIIELEKDFRRECHPNDLAGDGQEASLYSRNFKLSRVGNSEQYQKLRIISNRLREYS